MFYISCFSADSPVYMYSMGGMAEYCVTPAHGLAPLPESLPYSESAILGCAVFTAYGAMAHAAEIRPGDSIAVIGIGGVGSRYVTYMCHCLLLLIWYDHKLTIFEVVASVVCR